MEEYNQEQNVLRVDSSSRSYMLETARWAKFLAIMGFVAMGIIMLGAIALMFTKMPMTEDSTTAFTAGYKTGMLLFYIILILIFFYPMYALLKFANLVKTSVATQNQQEFDEAFRFLKNTFKFWGIYTIVLLFIYGVTIIFALTIAVTSNI
jgi:hypothetical protein